MTMMRVITGIAKGRRLFTLEGNDVRPTSEKVKEAIFSIIQFEIEGRRVLDLFAGSGQLGIEALSRGAESAVFVDSSRAAVDVIKKNLEVSGLYDKAVVKNTNALTFLETYDSFFDIAFVDPPYSQGLAAAALERLPMCMSESGIIICETRFNEELPTDLGSLKLYRTYKYSKTSVSVYRPK
ncbi:MAG TPA: 16S rRNA (guanine(966)-N(2))-methyltransferase RsmD [Clostridiales bacterium]|nr:16S rRNA (guanine(966)-N(2))-methyltransferase RsmD [Clostridiales bacterium]HOJ34991.1 16S rRNA (guanine(966)-N(2))-methyltransferase RsmD [Clostridiales bacterium]HOL79464.1 16S rRNA (guanine(966)-N(2))-methyltransferase RsmD [Clostridiales bacterium]HPP68726.1 16S rRNA (guanine(966)-N(2))-methyltransferase RsmD [Clostridiales bacterium]HPU66713.1 16S rRNA (guanine(966)-N(2))-methyltransferase RsmD [Clostridiales bacterium]